MGNYKQFLLLLLVCLPATAHAAPLPALHLMTYQPLGYRVDDTPAGRRLKRILARAVALGFRSVVFNFRAHMVTGWQANIQPTVPAELMSQESALLLPAVHYAQSLGLSVQFRPILLVVGPNGEFPYRAKGRVWWHGNIQPENPAAWFEAYFAYHRRYLELAREAGVNSYSLGAEMHSLTTGYRDDGAAWTHGFPAAWTKLVGRARAILGTGARISYGMNYTDEIVLNQGTRIQGGELEQWHIQLTETPKTLADQRQQEDLRAFLLALDEIGIDYYRALASPAQVFPHDLGALTTLLQPRARSHADQLNNALTEIFLTLGVERPVSFQEVGYRSVKGSFLHPASYESQGGEFDENSQAAAWGAFLGAFWQPGWSWMGGVSVWEVLVDKDLAPFDTGFSPLGKAVESVFRRYFQQDRNASRILRYASPSP